MTNIFNIAGADGNVMVPVLSETGSLMALVLYTDSTGILQELMAARPSPGNTQSLCKRVSEQQQSENRLQRRTLLIINLKINNYETANFGRIRNQYQR